MGAQTVTFSVEWISVVIIIDDDDKDREIVCWCLRGFFSSHLSFVCKSYEGLKFYGLLIQNRHKNMMLRW